MQRDLSLVEVAVYFCKAGLKLYSEDDFDADFWHKSLEDTTKELKPTPVDSNLIRREPFKYELTEDNIAFKFKVIGESRDGVFSSNLDAEVKNIGVAFCFGEMQEDLDLIIKTAKERLPNEFNHPKATVSEKLKTFADAMNDMEEDDKVEVVRCIFLYAVDTYYIQTMDGNDYDMDIINLGPIDLRKLETELDSKKPV